MITHNTVSAFFKIKINPKQKTIKLWNRSTLKTTNYCNISNEKMDKILLEYARPLSKRRINNLIKIIKYRR
jgi:hypothetical protein